MNEQDKKAVDSMSKITGVRYSDEQKDILLHRGGMCILACAGSGKALKNGIGVLTPSGYKAVEQLKVGDICFDEQGNRQTILGVYPQGMKEVYTVEFSDNRAIDCCSEHLWPYSLSSSRKWKIGTTEEIMELLEDNKLVRTPAAEAVKFEDKSNLMIPGYLLGFITEHLYYNYPDKRFSCHSWIDISDRVVRELYDLGLQLERVGDTNLMNLKELKKGALSKLIKQLCKLGIFEKSEYGYSKRDSWIPDEYLYSDIKTRVGLLTAYVDMIGQVRNNEYEIHVPSSVSERFVFLVESLGYRARLSYGPYICWDLLKFHCSDRILTTFLKDRLDWEKKENDKLLVAKETNRKVPIRPRIRYIKRIIKKNEMAEMTCIKVSGKSELFITENFVVTHNTTLLTHLLAKRIWTHEIGNTDTLLCTTYSKAGAVELETRLNKLLEQLGIYSKVNVKTLHSLYLSVLRYFGYPTEVISNRDRRKYILDGCKAAEVILDEEDFQTLDSLLSYQVNNLLADSALVQSYAFTLDDVSLDQYSTIRKYYNNKKIQSKLIDYDDMQLYLYSMLYNNKTDVLDYCRRNYTDIYIDEAQDISKIQFAILKKIITDPNKLVFIGDDDQCIYQWRGADPSIILNICAEYDIHKFILSTNYRCAGNIVEKAAVGIKNNSRRSDKSMKPFNEGGEIKVCDCGSSNLYTMSKYAYKHIKGLIEDGVREDKIAVLSRNNQHLALLSNMLFKDGIHCVSSADMKLSKMTAYSAIKSILALAEDSYNANLTADTINKVTMYMKKSEAKTLGYIQDSAGICLSDLLGYLNKNYWHRKEIQWDGKFKIPALAEGKIVQSLDGLKADTITSLVAVYNILKEEDKAKRVAGLLSLYLASTEWQYSRNADKKRSIEGLVDYIIDLMKTVGFKEINSYLKVTEQYEEGKMAVPGFKVCMSTMHSSKGREWDHVILFADDNITFPSFSGIETRLRNGVATSDVYYEIDENRRLHYVAMTRAKKELTVFTDRKNIGVYLLEAFGIFNTGPGVNNANIITMASNGQVYPELLAESDKIIFGKESPYNYEMDISGLIANIEIDYFYRGNNRKTLDIGDIKTV